MRGMAGELEQGEEENLFSLGNQANTSRSYEFCFWSTFALCYWLVTILSKPIGLYEHWLLQQVYPSNSCCKPSYCMGARVHILGCCF